MDIIQVQHWQSKPGIANLCRTIGKSLGFQPIFLIFKFPFIDNAVKKNNPAREAYSEKYIVGPG